MLSSLNGCGLQESKNVSASRSRNGRGRPWVGRVATHRGRHREHQSV